MKKPSRLSGRRAPGRHRARPSLEPVERRWLLSTFSVTTADDNGDDSNPLPGSLRAAIVGSNAMPGPSGPNQIVFDPSVLGDSIVLSEAPLQTITNPVIIDARDPQSGKPGVVLDGSSLDQQGSADGLDVNAPDTLIEGLVVVNFPGSGIVLAGAGHDTVTDDYIGVGIDGQSLGSNGANGVEVTSPGNTIGSPNEMDAKGVLRTLRSNVITNNGVNDPFGDGILIQGAAASGNLVLGNFLGVDLVGDTGKGTGNHNNGVQIIGAPRNTIGGPTPAARNIISFNGVFEGAASEEDGVEIEQVGATGNLVQGNYIGLDVAGSSQLANASDGVQIVGAAGNTIRGNVISGNSTAGVTIQDASASGNVVAGNIIGLDASGSGLIPNADSGIQVDGSPGNTIGGYSPADRNIVSANGGIGIYLTSIGSSPASGNLVVGNYVGTDLAGDTGVDIGNKFSGIRVDDSSNNTIGAAGAGNVVANNLLDGIFIKGADSRGNVIRGNIVGLDPTGEFVAANNSNGIDIEEGSDNTVGGSAAGERNVVSGNGGDGIVVAHSGSGPTTAVGNVIEGNLVGLDAAGEIRVSNLLNGIILDGAARNTVGGTTPGAGNAIGKNFGRGIEIQDNGFVGSDDNLIAGNFVGTDATGRVGLGNLSEGIYIGNGSGNTIGGVVPAARNVILSNLSTGISIYGNPIDDPADPTRVIGNTSTHNLIEGNYIGLDSSGTVAYPNGSDGIFLQATVDNTIGGTTPGAGNVIFENFGSGINISIDASSQLVQGNFIGIGTNGLASLGNHGSGVLIYRSTDNTIGGTSTGAGNVISKNQISGVDLSLSSTRNVVEGNLVGVDPSGRVAAGNGLNGITIENGANNNTVGGLAGAASRNLISGNTDNGIAILQGANGPVFANVLEGNFVGTDLTGSTAIGLDGRPLGNLSDGLLIDGASLNAIGGNVFSGNGLVGVNITGGPGASGNRVFGNEIGTDSTGARASDASGRSLGNQGNGLVISNAAGNTIGGVAAGLGNVISGNAGIGVDIAGASATGNVLQGNRIGVDASGSVALGNTSDGVQVFDSGGNLIGGLEPGAGNLISANRGSGVHVFGSSNAAVGNALFGNRIGSDASTTLALDASGKMLGNSGGGVLLDQVSGTFLYANFIVANKGAGVDIEGGSANLLATNFIGTGIAGSSTLGNTGSGVLINDSPGNTIGGLTASSRNILSGNQADGLDLNGPKTVGNFIVGDWIGVDGAGSAGLGNLLDGVRVDRAGAGNDVSGNLISANGGAGIELTGPATGSTTVQANLIGTDSTGSVALGNSVGVYLNDVQSITIGGTSASARNVISGNRTLGIDIFQVDATIHGETIEGNWIGPDAAGTNIPSGSTQTSGVFIDNAAGNLVGGTTPGAGNVISGNSVAGVYVFGQAGVADVDNRIEGNIVGAFPGVSLSRVPVAQGVGVLVNTSAGNTIGGPGAGAGNFLAGNQTGVEVVGATSSTSVRPTNSIQQNVVAFNAVGVFLNEASGNLVGGPLAIEANFIRGNSLEGLAIFGALATGNVVEGNDISANTIAGAYLDAAIGNVIGGAVANVISNNGAPKSSNGVGVFLNDGASGNTIARNQIRKNTGYGVFLLNSARNVPGVSRVGRAKNLFGGNGIADFREFTGTVSPVGSKPTKAPTKK
jgi:parallel beta-helix repeat protein